MKMKIDVQENFHLMRVFNFEKEWREVENYFAVSAQDDEKGEKENSMKRREVKSFSWKNSSY